MSTDTTSPAVWLGCLACYNGGDLVGAWMAPDEAADVTTEELHRIAAGPDGRIPMDVATHEELWVMDHEHTPLTGEFGPLECRVIADAFEAVGADDWPAYLAYAATGTSADQVPDASEFREAYAGEFDSFRDYADELADETLGVPATPCSGEMWTDAMRQVGAAMEFAVRYFDYDAHARDLLLGGDMSTEDAPGGGVFVFRAI